MKFLTPAALLSLFALTAIGEDKKEMFDASKLVGEYSYVSGMDKGEKVPADHLKGTVVITKDTITMPAPGEGKFVTTYKIDGSVTPARIDMVMKEAPTKDAIGMKAKGLVVMKGENLMICYAIEFEKGKGEYPEKLESTEKNKALMFTLKKSAK